VIVIEAYYDAMSVVPALAPGAEMSCSIMHKHIALYVNQFTLDIGREGEKALEYLLELGRQKGVFPGKKKKGLPVVLPASV